MLGVNIDPLTMNETVDRVEEFIVNKRPLHLMGVNADKINQCHSNKEIKKILSSRNEKLLKNISEADIFDKNLESMVDDVSKKFNEDILKLETNHKLLKDINKKIIAEEKNKSHSLKNSYFETKKYINNIDSLNMSVNKGKVKVYQKENIPKIGTNYETN